MKAEEIKIVLGKHAAWLRDDDGGEKANLRGADLSRADLSEADLSRADLSRADLRGADLSGANLDYSCWPLCCGSKGVKVDAKIAAQLAAHFCVLDCDDPAYQAARAAVMEFAKTSHRAEDLGLIEEVER